MTLTMFEKLEKTKEAVRCFYEAFDGAVYLAWSGGRDSTVLAHIIRGMGLEIPFVFNNTGNEYPEILKFVRDYDYDKKIVLVPKKNFVRVLEEDGYPVISKEQAQCIRQYRNTKSEKLRSIRWSGNKYGRGKISEKWKFMVNAPFKVSERCCDHLKKKPAKEYERVSGRLPIFGVTAGESSLRHQASVLRGCNHYDTKRPTSKPMMFWSSDDVKQYVEEFSVAVADIYSKGYERTGCMFCLFGVDQNKPNKFQVMATTHPKQWAYCMNHLGIRRVLEFMGQPYGGFTDAV